MSDLVVRTAILSWDIVERERGKPHDLESSFHYKNIFVTLGFLSQPMNCLVREGQIWY